MRKEDPTGDYVVCPDAPAAMVPRTIDDPPPYYRLYPEGHIEDFDGDTIPSPHYLGDNYPDLNRNFPFRWRTEPYCNVLTVTVTPVGGVYTLDGFDEPCGGNPKQPGQFGAGPLHEVRVVEGERPLVEEGPHDRLSGRAAPLELAVGERGPEQEEALAPGSHEARGIERMAHLRGVEGERDDGRRAARESREGQPELGVELRHLARRPHVLEVQHRTARGVAGVVPALEGAEHHRVDQLGQALGQTLELDQHPPPAGAPGLSCGPRCRKPSGSDSGRT